MRGVPLMHGTLWIEQNRPRGTALSHPQFAGFWLSPDVRRQFTPAGPGSPGAWLAWRCALDPRSAREHVRVARALEGLEEVKACFARGELSYSKVRAIARIATPQIESELVEMARWATASQLERLVRGYRRAVSLESAETAHRDRFLATEWEEDGSLIVRGRLSPEDGALFLKAIEAGKQAIYEREVAHAVCSQGGSAEPEPGSAVREHPRVSRADALMEVAERSLGGAAFPRPAAERHQVVVHAEATALAGEAEEPGARLKDGGLALRAPPPPRARGRLRGPAQARRLAPLPPARRAGRSHGPLPRPRQRFGASSSQPHGGGGRAARGASLARAGRAL